jgi:hypothetical protein
MHGDNFGAAFFRNNQTFVQRQCRFAGSAFARAASTSVIDQDSPHHLRRDTKEMCAALPMHVPLVHQAKKSLINKRGCLKRVTGRFPSHVPPCQSVKFLVND